MKKIMKAIRNFLAVAFGGWVVAANEQLVGVHPNGSITYVAGGSITRGALVKFSSGKVVVSGANDRPIGIAQDTVVANDTVAVKLLGNAPGTIIGLAGEAIAQGAALYGAASGELVDTAPTDAGTYYLVGYALAAAADGDPVEIQHAVPSAVVVEAAQG